MGFLVPTIRPGQLPEQQDEVARLEARARLPRSTGAGLLKVVGLILILLSVLAFSVSPLGLVGTVSGAIGGGLIWAAGAVLQIAFDLRTLKLREFDCAETASLQSRDHA